jgi:hypothetical protein
LNDLPIKSKTRAKRRFHKQRKIQQAKEIAKRFYFFDTKGVKEDWVCTWALRNADNLKKCSCYMCGNQRKYLGKTFQELKHSA